MQAMQSQPFFMPAATSSLADAAAHAVMDVTVLTATSTSNGTNTTSEHSDQDKAVLFLSVVLMIGAALKYAVNRLRVPLPYTVLLLVVGMGLGAINIRGEDNFKVFGEAMDVFSEMDPHLFLIIFLPALIFESSFATNFHIVWREIGQALLLAGPGVVISTVLTALVARFLFPYDWSWSVALMFGAMMSATDPVAVVALLREVGASKRLATLIEAESLLNDGTAFVFFLIFKDFATGEEERNAIEIIAYMCRLSLGGVALGLCMGFITVWTVSHVFNDAQVETIATISVAYLTFYVAESESVRLHVSGVLAVVTLGLYMSKHKAAISPRIESNVHHVWDMLAYIANTLIFVISGIIVANNFFSSSSDNENGDSSVFIVGFEEIGYSFMLYILLMIIRGIAVATLSPALSRVGYGLTTADACVLVYGGLRGAIGLALGLLVQLEETLDQATRDRVMFYMSAIVLLTLIVNGSTTKHVLVWTGLAKVKRASNRVYTKALRHLENETAMLISSLKHHKHYSGANWGEIRKMLPQYGDRVRDAETKDKAAASAARSAQMKATRDRAGSRDGAHAIDAEKVLDVAEREAQRTSPLQSGGSPSSPDLEDDIRVVIDHKEVDEMEMELKLEVSHRFISAMKACYWHQYEEGMTTRRAVSVLVEAAETALDIDNLRDLYMQWEDIQHHFVIPKWMSRVQNCVPMLGNRMLYSRLAFSVELATGFLMASESIEEIEKHFPEFGEFDVVNLLKEECMTYRREALDVWLQIQNSFPEVYRSIQTKHAAQFILTKEKHTIQELYELGILDERESQVMNELVDKSMYKLERARPVTQVISDRNSILQELDFFAHLPQDLQHQMRNSEVQVFNPGKTLFSVGDRLSCVYIVIRGIINVYSVSGDEIDSAASRSGDDESSEMAARSPAVQAMGVGSVLGMYEALSGHVAFEAAKSQTYVEAVILPTSVLREFSMLEHLQQYLWKIAAIAVIKSHFMSDFGYSAVSVGRACQRAIFVTAHDGDYITVSTPILLLTGDAEDTLTKEHCEGPTFFPVTNRELSFISDANLLVFRARRKTPRSAYGAVGASASGAASGDSRAIGSHGTEGVHFETPEWPDDGDGTTSTKPRMSRAVGAAASADYFPDARKRAASRAADRAGMMRIRTLGNELHDHPPVRHNMNIPGGLGGSTPRVARRSMNGDAPTSEGGRGGLGLPVKSFRVRRLSRHLKGHINRSGAHSVQGGGGGASASTGRRGGHHGSTRSRLGHASRNNSRRDLPSLVGGGDVTVNHTPRMPRATLASKAAANKKSSTGLPPRSLPPRSGSPTPDSANPSAIELGSVKAAADATTAELSAAAGKGSGGGGSGTRRFVTGARPGTGGMRHREVPSVALPERQAIQPIDVSLAGLSPAHVAPPGSGESSNAVVSAAAATTAAGNAAFSSLEKQPPTVAELIAGGGTTPFEDDIRVVVYSGKQYLEEKPGAECAGAGGAAGGGVSSLSSSSGSGASFVLAAASGNDLPTVQETVEPSSGVAAAPARVDNTVAEPATTSSSSDAAADEEDVLILV